MLDQVYRWRWQLTITGIVAAVLLVALATGASWGVDPWLVEGAQSVLMWVMITVLAPVFVMVVREVTRDADGNGRSDFFEDLEDTRRDKLPPGGPGAVLLLLAVSLGVATSTGCAASAVRTHATAALYTTHAVRVGGEAIDRARDAHLDEVAEEAEAEARAEVQAARSEPELIGEPAGRLDIEDDAAPDEEAGPDADAEEAMVRALVRSALIEAGRRWEPVGAGLDAVRESLHAWVDAIDLARIADDEGIGVTALLPLAARTVALYSRAVTLAASLDEELPPLPPWLTMLVRDAR